MESRKCYCVLKKVLVLLSKNLKVQNMDRMKILVQSIFLLSIKIKKLPKR